MDIFSLEEVYQNSMFPESFVHIDFDLKNFEKLKMKTLVSY